VIVPMYISMAVEDLLSERILRRLLRDSCRPYAVCACHGHRGKSYLRQVIPGLNHAAQGVPFLVLTDLDTDHECAPALVNDWLGGS
jgi:hypothetical protein